GKTSGMDLCRALLALNPRTNVVFLTAHSEYAFDAWSTGASGFLLKPITPEAVQAHLENLRNPFVHGAGANAALPAPAPALGHPWPSGGDIDD
ncbi:MAG: response regulator, partial [Schwartzia sp.]|nr:response regulator [Schwartzia sp. (in: firmicutes)]